MLQAARRGESEGEERKAAWVSSRFLEGKEDWNEGSSTHHARGSSSLG